MTHDGGENSRKKQHTMAALTTSTTHLKGAAEPRAFERTSEQVTDSLQPLSQIGPAALPAAGHDAERDAELEKLILRARAPRRKCNKRKLAMDSSERWRFIERHLEAGVVAVVAWRTCLLVAGQPGTLPRYQRRSASRSAGNGTSCMTPSTSIWCWYVLHPPHLMPSAAAVPSRPSTPKMPASLKTGYSPRSI